MATHLPAQGFRGEDRQPVIALARVAGIGESFRQCARKAEAVIHLTQQQRPAVAGEVAAGKIGADLAGPGSSKSSGWGGQAGFGRAAKGVCIGRNVYKPLDALAAVSSNFFVNYYR